ncbi:TPA: GFA family protein [Serratia fonticola]
MSKIFSGGCLCGFIRFEATKPSNSHMCSCNLCQKHTGSQTVVWIEFSSKDVQWVGEGHYPATYRSSEFSSRAFCSRCGSSIGAIDDAPTVALLTGVFDTPNDLDLKPGAHSFEDMTPEWWRKMLQISI